MAKTDKNGNRINVSDGVQGFHEYARTATDVIDGVLGAPADGFENQRIGSMSDEQYAEWASDPDELASLALHSDSWVRTLVARNVHTPDNVVEDLLHDKSMSVRRAAALRLDGTEDGVASAWYSGALSPTDVAGHEMSSAGVIAEAVEAELADTYSDDDMVSATVHNLITHENADSRAVRAAIGSDRIDATTLAAAIDRTTSSDDLQRAAERLTELDQSDPQVQAAWKRLILNEQTGEPALDLVPHATADYDYDLLLAQAPLSYERFSELVEGLDSHPDREDLAYFLGKNPDLPHPALIALMGHPDEKVRAAAMANPNISTDMLEAKAELDPSVRVREAAEAARSRRRFAA